MIKHILKKQSIYNLRKGVGEVEIQKIIDDEDINQGIKMIAKVIIKPKSSIGYHKHTDEGEIYYILEGEGVFIDEKGKRNFVKNGDACITRNNQSHGIENNSDKDVSIIAIVFNDVFDKN